MMTQNTIQSRFMNSNSLLGYCQNVPFFCALLLHVTLRKETPEAAEMEREFDCGTPLFPSLFPFLTRTDHKLALSPLIFQAGALLEGSCLLSSYRDLEPQGEGIDTWGLLTCLDEGPRLLDLVEKVTLSGPRLSACLRVWRFFSLPSFSCFSLFFSFPSHH